LLVRDSDTIFLVSVDPVLARGDLRAVLARLRENWPPARLVRLLASPHCAVAKTAASDVAIRRPTPSRTGAGPGQSSTPLRLSNAAMPPDVWTK